MSNKVLLLVLLSSFLVAQYAKAEEVKPIQLAVFNPVQLVSEDKSISGVRLSLFYTVNKNVSGVSAVWLGVNRVTGDAGDIELGLVNWVEGNAYGVQIGIVNHVGKQCGGLQYGMVNTVGGDFTGVQWGLVNWTEGLMRGGQAGVVNYAKEVRGLQLGVVNYTKSLDGLQIGLGNYNGNKKPMEFMVLVNWSF